MQEQGLDLRGPRARLYMSVDKVVANCGGSDLAAVGAGEHQSNSRREGAGPAAGVANSRPRSCGPPARRGVALLPHPGAQHQPPPGPHHKAHTRSGPGHNHKPPAQPRLPVGRTATAPPHFSTSAPPPIVPEEELQTKDPDVFLLEELEAGVLESLGPGQEGVAKEVADGWRGQQLQLAKIYSEMLESRDSETEEATVVRRSLGALSREKGGQLVSRDKAILLTTVWLVNNPRKREQRIRAEFQVFLDSRPNFKLTLDEIVYILGRNGMAMVDLSQDFDETTSAVNFKTFIQELVALPGQLLANFTDVIFSFFKSRIVATEEEPKMLVKNVNEAKDIKQLPVIFTGEDIREKKDIRKVPDQEGKSPRQSVKKAEEIVNKESCIKMAKVQEENKALRGAQNILQRKIEKVEKEFEAERI